MARSFHVPPYLRTLVADGVVTPKEAARLLGIGHSTLYELMSSGDIPVVQLRGSRKATFRRIPRLAITRYLAEHLTS
ncbi:MAG: helix-turn-helix domain-containing protein [Candidatus Eremiobacteraeota bacterium]|nr:helix-turn-helix domain-containing protein [Candidatus Eremiobacteraeota bacterium]